MREKKSSNPKPRKLCGTFARIRNKEPVEGTPRGGGKPAGVSDIRNTLEYVCVYLYSHNTKFLLQRERKNDPPKFSHKTYAQKQQHTNFVHPRQHQRHQQCHQHHFNKIMSRGVTKRLLNHGTTTTRRSSRFPFGDGSDRRQNRRVPRRSFQA